MASGLWESVVSRAGLLLAILSARIAAGALILTRREKIFP